MSSSDAPRIDASSVSARSQASPEVARIRAFKRGTLELVADEVVEIPEGWVTRTASLPAVWMFNHVGVSGPVSYGSALELVERHMADRPYRHLVIEDEPSGYELESRLKAEGWQFDRDVSLVLRREPDRNLDTSAVVGADEAEALGLMRQWTGEQEELRRSPEAHRQVLEAIRQVWHTRNAQRFGILGADGRLVAMTILFSDGVVAQVEDVFVVPEERGRGFGRALVTHAALTALDAGHELVFIVGDDNGWPKHLYADIGFEPVERSWEFQLG